MQIIFRVDGSYKIGGGHVMRCAVLAKELIKRGASVIFLTKVQPGDYSLWLEQTGIPVIKMSDGEFSEDVDALEVKNIINKYGKVVDWLIVDHYCVNKFWESQLRDSVNALMVIDDLGDRSHHCDLLLNHNYMHHMDAIYEHLIPSTAVKLLGPKYALLPEAYAALRKSKLRDRNGEVKRILVCFGATDPKNHTAITLDVLSMLDAQIERIDVVTTPQNINFEKICKQFKSIPNIHFHCPAHDLPTLLNESDLAIGAGGVMSLERAALGVPSLCFGVAPNQFKVLKNLITDGMAVGFPMMEIPDAQKINAWLKILVGNPDLLIGLARRSINLVDSYGASRVADLILTKKYSFRYATLNDMDFIYVSRNQSSVRDKSLNTLPIDYDVHVNWYKKVIGDASKILLIISFEGLDVGVVRFDCCDDQATISIYKTTDNPKVKGLIKQSTDWLRKNRHDIKNVNARVLSENVISAQAFRNAGYRDCEYYFTINLQDES